MYVPVHVHITWCKSSVKKISAIYSIMPIGIRVVGNLGLLLSCRSVPIILQACTTHLINGCTLVEPLLYKSEQESRQEH